METEVMELRIRHWIPILEEQARSGLSKSEWCIINGIDRGSFFRWQKRVRSYLLEQGGSIDRMQAEGVIEQTDDTCFVELPCVSASASRLSAMLSIHNGVAEEGNSISIQRGGFFVHVNGEVNERQLTAVLRAMKNAD